MKNFKSVLYTFTALAAMGLPSAAFAQAEPSEANDIIVTAQRRAERLEDVPASITAITPQIVERANVVGLQDIGRVAAGVQVNFGGANTQTAIRGVTTLTNGTGVENNVGVYIDGFYEPNSTFINADFANIAGIEVLKGPQGTLYGRNATGGAILINTLDPTDTFAGRGEVSYARFDDKIVKGYVSGPIAENVSFIVAGYMHRGDGYTKLIANPLTGAKAGNAAPITQDSIRAKIKVELSPGFSATLGYNYQLSDDARGQLFTPFDYVPATHPAPPLRATRVGTASYNFKNLLSNRAHQGTLRLDIDTGFGELTTRTSYTTRLIKQRFDFDGTFVNNSYNFSDFSHDTFQQAADLVFDGMGRLDLIVGGLYYNDKVDQSGKHGSRAASPSTPSVIGPFTSILSSRQNTEALAVYVDATYRLTDQITLNAGGRYSREHKDAFIQNERLLPTPGFILVPTTNDVTFKKFTPRVSIRYELAPRTNVYASYSTGFRAGVFNQSGAPNPASFVPTRPETIDAFEVGFKTAGSNYNFNVAGFYYDYKDINASLTVPRPDCAGQVNCPIASIFANAKKARIYGIDGEVSFNPVPELTIRANAAWLHARYVDFDNAVGTEVCIGQSTSATNPAAACTVLGTNLSNRTQDWSGYQMARAPNFSGNIGVDYEAPLGGGELLLSGNVSYTDSYVVSNPSLFCSFDCDGAGGTLAPKQRYRTGARALLSAQATWTDPSDRFYVGVFGRNLTNKFWRATYNGAGFGDYSTMGEPRVYGARVGVKFGGN